MRGEARLTIHVLLGGLLTQRGPPYTLVRLLQGMQSPEIATTLFAPLDRWTLGPTGIPTVTGGVGKSIDRRLPYRYISSHLMRRAERRLLSAVDAKSPSIVFTWGEVSLDVSRTLRDRGVPVVREKFNCAKVTAKRILDRAYAYENLPAVHGITDALIAKEAEELELAEGIFCPSPMVTKSLVELGLPPERLLPTSYGWEPARFAGTDKALTHVEGPTLIFVGRICVRKGAHILLEAWRRANIRGRLVLVGDIEPLVEQRYREVLGRPDVVYVPYTDNIGAYYRSADWFIFPTLEEGGPQVTYEAGGNGLPVLVSPMGAGAFARHGLDGIVVDSDEAGPWAEAISALPDMGASRLEFAASARAHALEFTYDKVGARRRELLLARFAPEGGRRRPSSRESTEPPRRP